jgi:hypothetical protein
MLDTPGNLRTRLEQGGNAFFIEYYEQLAADLDELLRWIQRRDVLLNEVLYYSAGACKDLSSNCDLLSLENEKQRRFVESAARELALGISWIRKGKEEQGGDFETADLAEPLAEAAESLAGNAIDWLDEGISKREKKRGDRARLQRKKLAAKLRIETAIEVHNLAASDFLEHLASAYKALHDPAPEDAVY